MRWVEELRGYPPLNRFHLFGIAGSCAATAGTIGAMIPYVGAQGERFSILNHFISELGRVGVSPLAPLFNGGLVVAGILYVPFALGLGTMLGGWWAAAGTVAALVSAVSVAGVGIFPMNDLQPHIMAAMTFFRSGLLTMLLFGVAIHRQKRERTVVDRRANIAGGVALLAYAAFLAWIWERPGGSSGLDASFGTDRPAVWTAALLEWAVMAASVAWFLVVGLCRKRGPERSRG